MSQFKLLIFTTFTFLLASTAFGQEFSEAKAIEKSTFAESFEFSAFENRFSVDAKSGKAHRTGGARATDFQLPLEKDDEIEKIYFSELGDDLLLLYTFNEGGYAASTLTRLDGKTNKLKWKAQIPAFNIVGFLDGDRSYIAGTGFIGAVNLATGKFVWKHENLYNEKYGKINIFAVPQVEAGKIVFRSSEKDAYTKKIALVVDKTSGRLLSVK
jgi:outer membrane protein assembly factor BamB